MDADSEPETEGVGGEFANDKPFKLFTRVRDAREELGRCIQRMSAKSTLTITDRLLLAYYQKTLKFIEPLAPETLYNSGMTIWKYCSDHQEEACEIKQILDYLIPEGEIKKGLLRALPGSARSSFKKGRPVTRRPSALRALHLWTDGEQWLSITH